jgi:hypothetical protein
MIFTPCDLTHPDITAFVDPLFAFGGKRVVRYQNPLSRLRKRGWSSVLAMAG